MIWQTLYLHWKGARLMMLPFIVIAFVLPITAVQGFGEFGGSAADEALYAASLLRSFELWLIAFPMLAIAVGAVPALTVWSWDHVGQHVYALSLPISRTKYTLIKMGAGASLVFLAAAFFWVGSLIATSAAHVPEGIQAYPTLLSLRFLLAALLVYAFLFSLAAGTVRNTVIGAVVLVVLVVAGDLSWSLLDGTAVGRDYMSFEIWLIDGLQTWPSPFRIFTGSWMLFDV